MENTRLAVGTIITIAAGAAMGFAANPVMKDTPGSDWRERYRASGSAVSAPDPAPGVSYYGDGSTAWVYGGAPWRVGDREDPVRALDYGNAADIARLPPLPDAPVYREPPPDTRWADDLNEAQRIVADAMVRSTPAEPAPARAGTDERSARPAVVTNASGADDAAVDEGAAGSDADAGDGSTLVSQVFPG